MRHSFCIIIFLLLAGTSHGVTLTDNFNRADANPIGGNWSTQTGEGANKIVSNQVKGTGGSNTSYWNADSFSNDQYSELVLQGTPTSSYGAGASVRTASGAQTLYLWHAANGSTMNVYKRVTGTWTQIGSSYSLSSVPGTVLKLEVAGTTLTPYFNGAAQATRTDSAIASGSAGFRIYNTTMPIDDWAGGDLGGTSLTILDFERGRFRGIMRGTQ